MELHNKVQGTMASVPYVEENYNNVYLRSNVQQIIKEDGTTYWLYDEILLTITEYASLRDTNIFDGIFERMKG
jgi:hypothetical protein